MIKLKLFINNTKSDNLLEVRVINRNDPKQWVFDSNSNSLLISLKEIFINHWIYLFITFDFK
jgi:hypothetical protein